MLGPYLGIALRQIPNSFFSGAIWAETTVTFISGISLEAEEFNWQDELLLSPNTIAMDMRFSHC
jgi:hypothetical protein